jgi:hypothetical protein
MTTPIDLDTARAFLKADGDDDDLINAQISSATQICEDYCNRAFYVDAAGQQDDFSQALIDRTAALLNRKTAMDSVTGSTPDDDITRAMIRDHYIQVLGQITQRINGIVLDDAINAAILITLGHLYKNREDNLATGNNVVQVPVGAQRILQSKLWIGNLADGGVCIDWTAIPPVEGS